VHCELLVIALLWSAAFSGGVVCAPGKQCQVDLHLDVPQAVTAQAARRRAGEATAPAPFLMLHGLEFGTEGFDIEVRSKPGATESEGEVLGNSAIVGSVQATNATSRLRRKIDLPIPLNDDALQLLSNHVEIDLTLKIIPVTNLHSPIKLDSVSFQMPTKP
jgi:hypothetical protein